MPGFTHHRAKLAALSRHGAAPEVLDAVRRELEDARRDMAAAETLRFINVRRARFGLPPLDDPVVDAVTRAVFLGEREAA